MLCPGLYAGQSRVREHADSNTNDDLAADQSGDVGWVRTGSVADQETKADGEEAAAKDDEAFQAADAHDDDAEDDTGEGTGKCEDGTDTGGGKVGLTKGDLEDGEEEGALHVPG